MSSAEEFHCVACHKYLLFNPVQCSCGDRLCGYCFRDYSKNAEEFECPKCSETLSVKECFLDKAFFRIIRETILECSNSGCSWKGPGDQYEVHLKDECTSVMQDCKNGCGIQVPKKEMEHHMKSMCTYQPQHCEFKEEGCQYIGHTKVLEEHYASSIQMHLKLTTKDSLKSIEKSMESKLLSLAQQISDLKSEINHVHREISVKIKPVVSAMSKAETAIQSLQEGFSELALMVQTMQASSYNGSLIWKIPEVQRRRHEAKTGKTISLYSAPFYTSRQGYKACLRLYMDGDGCGKNTHLSFFLTIMREEYDALLEWPFRHTVTLTLLDQDGNKNIAQSFRPEPTSSSFQRPKNEMNIASGCPMFAPLSVLNNSSYVKDDTMFLKCEIDTSGIKLP